MTAYLPNDFWTVAFWHTEGTAIPKVALRSLVFAIPALIAALMAEHQSKFRKVFGESSVLADQSVDQVPSGLITPFALLVALLTSHRLNSAHGKWLTANKSVLTLHAQTRLIISRLCAIFPPSPENKERIHTIRRLLVLACITIEKHIHRNCSANKFSAELKCGVLTPEEHKFFLRVTTVSWDDQKTDTFPTKCYPGMVFFMLHAELHKIFDAHKLAETPARTMVDADLAVLSSMVEELDYLSFTVLPIAYAQLTRLVSLAFLVILPFCAHVALSYGVIPLSIASNLIYFTVDHCASQMEAPFGDDLMDVDVHKMLRRIDKNTASLLSLYTEQPVLNYNLFPETRKTGQDGARLKWRKAQHSLGNVYKMDAKRRESAAEKREKFRNDRLSLVSKTKLRCASSAKKLTETLGLAWLEALHATRIQARVRGNASRRARSARWMQPHSSPAGIV